MDYSKRLGKLQSGMGEQGFDCVVYGVGANFQYFTGLPVKWIRMDEPKRPLSFLVVPAQGKPTVILEESASHLAKDLQIQTVITDSAYRTNALLKNHVTGRTIGVNQTAEDYISELLSLDTGKARISVADHLGDALRVTKSPGEIELLRKAAALAGDALKKVVPFIKLGVTQPELEKMLADCGKSLGADDVSFSPAALFVKSGTEPSENPFTYPQEKGLVPGTSVAFDYGFMVDGYCSDFGRSFYYGPAPTHFAGAYHALQTAQTELVENLVPGKTNIKDMFKMLEATMDRLGYGDRLRARLSDGTLGHQIGVDVHENPWIKPSIDFVLKPGMVMAIEPKVWLPGEYYLRVEDIVLITENGAEFLTSFDREMFELS